MFASQSLQFSPVLLHFQSLYFLRETDEICYRIPPSVNNFSISGLNLPLMTEISKSGSKQCPSEKVDCRIRFPSSDGWLSFDIIAVRKIT